MIEFVEIDIGPVAPDQNTRKTGVTLRAQDTSGPFDYHTLRMCREHDITHQIDMSISIPTRR